MNIRRHLVLLAIILLTGTDAAFAQTDEEQHLRPNGRGAATQI